MPSICDVFRLPRLSRPHGISYDSLFHQRIQDLQVLFLNHIFSYALVLMLGLLIIEILQRHGIVLKLSDQRGFL